MTNYDLSLLNHAEFESLVNDIIEMQTKNTIERFKPGKDLGIDGRFFSLPNDKTCIIQSKHYCKSGFPALLKDLQKRELQKIKTINPDRYILATSIPLNPHEKEKIHTTLSPYIKLTSDIYGADEICAFISNNNQLEKKYYKLWICSSSTLIRHLNQGTYESSKFEVSSIYEKAKHYAQTSKHDEAYQKLKKDHVVIIAGSPGVGKTTLAEQLCLASIAEGYDCIVINENVQEGFSVSETNSAQVFYFDDFLGSNYLSALEKNEGARITKFINYITKHDKRFILTSRANILDQAYQISQSLHSSNVNKHEYIIDVNSYTSDDKARILYNMLWKSDIRKEHFQAFLNKDLITTIIWHKNFNPRIIETITNNNLLLRENSNIHSTEDFTTFVLENLKHPSLAWDNAFTIQLDEPARALVNIVALSGGEISEEKLSEAYHNYTATNQIHRNSPTAYDFDTVIKPLCRTFITKNIRKDASPTYSPFNPSITDYIIHKLNNTPKVWANIERIAGSIRSINLLVQSHILNKKYTTQVADDILLKPGLSPLHKSAYYTATLGLYASECIFKRAFNTHYIEEYKNIIADNDADYGIHIIIAFIRRFSSIHNDTPKENIISAIMPLFELYLNIDNLQDITDVLNEHEIIDNVIGGKFAEATLVALEEWIPDYAADNIHKYAHYHDDAPYDDIATNHPALLNDTMDIVQSLYCPPSIEKISQISASIDLEDMLRDDTVAASRPSSRSTAYDIGEFDIYDLVTDAYRTKFEPE